jgi:hypothetical protein
MSGRARFLAAGSTTSITRGNLLNHFFINAASVTSNWRLFEAIRLKSIEIWASTATLGATTTASVEWFSENGPTVIHSDTSVGTAVSLYVRAQPPPRSLAGYWSLSGSGESTALFTIVAPANAVVDITYEAVLLDGEAATLVTTTNNGSQGQLYMAYLAGPTTTTFVPVSYASLT